MKTNIATIAIASLAIGACDQSAEPERVSIEDVLADAETRAGALPANVKEAEDYYVVRPDYRKCAYPLCGGAFLSKVNKNKTDCPTGGKKDECYVPDFVAPEGVSIEEGDLVHGEFGTTDILGEQWGTFEADFVYASVLDEPYEYGSHNLVFDTGIVCVQAPCPSTALAHLNHGWTFADFEYFFWGADADEDALLEEAFIQEYGADTSEAGGGAITFGDFWLLLGDVYYSVYNVYTLKVPQTPVCVVHDLNDETTAWSFDSEAAAQDLIAGLTGAVEILDGTCGEQLLFCPAVYEPVHGGIDANGGACEDHGNACEFRSAVIAAAGTAKAKGSWTAGTCE